MLTISRRTPHSSGYLPTLDGWRALSILAVILFHDSLHTFGPLSTRWFYEYGSYGVDVFFAISGFLICSRLLDEERVTGSIDLRRFYARRALRILPPAVAYLLVLAVLSRKLDLRVGSGEWLESLLFARNYGHLFVHRVGWYTGQFWSLALEEQFYFIFPAILVFAALRNRIQVLTALILGVFIHRALILRSHTWNHVRFHTDVRVDAILVAALFAVLAADPLQRMVISRWLRFWPLLVVAVVCIIPLGQGKNWQITLLTLLTPCVVLGSTLNSEGVFGRFLEWAPLRYLGRISYSLYLWQQLFFTHHFEPDCPTSRGSFGRRILLMAICAIGSYYLIEKPFARFSRRLVPSATPDREEDSKAFRLVESDKSIPSYGEGVLSE
ncbi:acyltransferase family protein [Granulicella sibirica]|uniref:O-antigen acetylase n=1 Tax=Granulicella sibirica TaxID=2479048 RepID=A0A4Q0T3J5_9BACT|nr:acyltransferase [Granulicella sibirica]RXH57847.1 O-antigen acetylase [Granulicella sibirica]